MVIAARLVLVGTAVAASCSNPGGQNVTRSDGTTYPYFGMPCSSSGISLSNILFFFFFGDWVSLSLALSTIEGSPWDCIGLWHYHCFTPSSPHVPSLYTLYIHVLVYQHQGPDSACGDCFLDMTCTCNQGCCTANPGPAGYACLPNSYVAIRMGQTTLVNKNEIEKLMAC